MSMGDEFYGEDESEEGSGRRLGLKIGVALVVAAVLVVGGVRWIDETEPSDGADPPAASIAFDSAVQAATSSPARAITVTSTSTVQVLAPTPTTPPPATTAATTPPPATTAPTTPPPATTAPTTPPPDSTAPATAAAARVEVIQTVPALRDFIVIIDGEPFATNSAGRIAVPDSASQGTIEVIGIRNEPPLWQVVFTSWSDGSTETARALDSIAGPVAQIGLLVSTRVIATAQPPVSGESSLVVSAADWTFTVPLDQPQWLPSARAVPAAGGLQEENFSYTATALLTDDGTQVLVAQSFHATPEAVWVIDAGSATGSTAPVA